jgi:hypothetical protein
VSSDSIVNIGSLSSTWLPIMIVVIVAIVILGLMMNNFYFDRR